MSNVPYIPRSKRGGPVFHRNAVVQVTAVFLPECCTRPAPYDCKVKFHEETAFRLVPNRRIVTHYFDEQTIAVKAWPDAENMMLKQFSSEAMGWLSEVHAAYYDERPLPAKEPLTAESRYALQAERLIRAEMLRQKFEAGLISREYLMRELDLLPELYYNAALDTWVEVKGGTADRGTLFRPVGKLAKPPRQERGHSLGSTPSGPTKYIRCGYHISQDESCNLQGGHTGEHERVNYRAHSPLTSDEITELLRSFPPGEFPKLEDKIRQEVIERVINMRKPEPRTKFDLGGLITS